MIYAVGDLHGCLDEWLTIKNRIEDKDKEAQFILIGDIIDRGPKVVEMCDWVVNNITNTGKYQMIIGNHEYDKLIYFDEYIIKHKDDLTKYWEDERFMLDDQYYSIQLFDTFEHYENFMNFCRTLRFYIDINVNNQRFILVHANLPFTAIADDEVSLLPDSELTERAKDFIVWDRDCIDFNKIPNTILINGHTPTIFKDALKYRDRLEDYSAKIYHTDNRYNIDCGLVYRTYGAPGNLGVLCLNTLEKIYLYN